MPYKSYLYLTLITLALSRTGLAQPASLRFDHIGTESGLSQSNITTILQDSRGFMWFGTRDGLDRYDGYEFTVFKNNPGDPKSLANNFITCITEDRNGDLWIATWGGGMDRYDRLHDRFIHYSTNPVTKFINAVLQDDKGNIWIGTNGGGADKLNPVTGNITHYFHGPNNSGLSDNDVKTILEDCNHNIWLGTTSGGLNEFDPLSGHFQIFRHDSSNPNSLAADMVQTLFEDCHHYLWVGTQGGGLDRYDSVTGLFHHYRNDPNDPQSLSNNVLMSLSEDEAGNIWVGTDNGGLNILNQATGKFHIYRKDAVDVNSLNNNSIHSLYRDPQGNMWVGTYSGGINLVSKAGTLFRQYVHTSSPESLTDNTILCIQQDHAKNIWIGTDGGGLDRLNRQTGEFTHFRHDKNSDASISGNYVLSVLEDERHDLWVGTWGDGLTLLDANRNPVRVYKNIPGDPRSLSGNNIYSIAEDRDKTIWIATYGGGLDRYNRATNTFTHYKHDEADAASLSSDRVHSLVIDTAGSLWVGTFDGGVDKLDKKTGRFTHYRHSADPHSLSDNSVNYLYNDKQGNIWICTSVGLNCLDPKTGLITNYFVKDGLPNDVIFGIQEDARGHYWISTNNGLSMYDPAKRIFHNFSAADGLQSNEFKAHACTAASDGTLYFGGVNGFNEFLPDSIHIQSFQPPLVITRFQIFNKDVPIADSNAPSPLKKDITDEQSLTLSYRSSVITFEFASLNYTLKAKKHYAYKLDGFDDKWNFIGTKRTATYTNINPGTYTFHVRALNEDGSWLPAEASIKLRIRPPFWRTWWFFLFSTIAVAVLISAGVRLRFNVIQHQKRQLEQQVRERTELLHKAIGEERLARLEAEKADRAKSDFLANMSHELRTPMNAIIGFSDLALASTLHEPQHTYVQNVQRAGQNLLSIINDILDYSKIEAGKLIIDNIAFDPSAVVGETVDILAIKTFEKGLELSCDIDPNLPAQIAGDPARWRQIIINLLGNAIKFTEKGEIVVTAKRVGDKSITISVRDTGIGIPKEKLGKIFERFTQADSSTTRNYGGTGLGLTIARHLAEMMGGTLSVESVIGQGSCFTLSMPLLIIQECSPRTPCHKPGLNRLLVVDDNNTNCNLMQAMLDYLGLPCHISRSGKEALQAIENTEQGDQPFDVIITDHQMPGMDGVELVKAIRSKWPASRQPFILMLSSLDRSLHQAEAENAGIDLFLSKPVKMRELDRVLCNIFEQRSAVTLPAPSSNGHAKPMIDTTVIVAEDDPVNMLLISEVLGKFGCTVVKATNGKEAIQRLDECKPAFILMDVNMPEMDGLEATRIIRNLADPRSTTPIIALTAGVMKKDKELCIEAGMDDFITKPFRMQEIEAVIGRYNAAYKDGLRGTNGVPHNS